MAKLKKAAIGLVLLCLILPFGVQAAETEAADRIPVYEMDTLPGNWSPLSSMTPEKEFLLDMTADRLYWLDENGRLTPSLAASLPVDVTADYAGSFGVPADAVRGYAFQIDLNEAACWEDGEPITADDFLFSIEQYRGNDESYVNLAVFEAGQTGETIPPENIVSLEEAGFDSVAQAREAGFSDFFVDTTRFWSLNGGWRSIDDRTRLRDFAMPSGLSEFFVTPEYLYETYLADGRDYDRWQREMIGVCTDAGEPAEGDAPGILKTGEHQLILILDQPAVSTSVALALEDLRLVRQSLWGETYGTSAEEYSSCGPYRIVSSDMELIVLARNENWYGQTDPDAPALIRCHAAA